MWFGWHPLDDNHLMFFEHLLNPTLPLRCLCAVRRSVSCYFTAIVHAFCCCHIDYFNSLPASFPMVQLSSFSRPCLQQLGPLPTFLASLTLMWWWTVMVSHESSRAVLSNPWPAFPSACPKNLAGVSPSSRCLKIFSFPWGSHAESTSE